MKNSRYIVLLALGVCLLACVAQFAYAQQDTNSSPAYVGTWKLNTAKSDYGKTPPPKDETLVIISSTPTSQKWTLDTTGMDGKPVHLSYDGATDDKYYPMAGDPDGGTFAFMKNGQWQIKDKTGKVVETGTVSVSADGKTLTIVSLHHDPEGDMKTTAVYDKASM